MLLSGYLSHALKFKLPITPKCDNTLYVLIVEGEAGESEN